MKKIKRNKNEKIKKIFLLGFVNLIIVLIIILLIMVIKNKHEGTIKSDVTNPEQYTWEEYIRLDPEEQALFPDYFDSMEEFNDWYNKASVADTMDNVGQIATRKLDLNDKNPKDFTWEEYMQFDPEEQAMFPDCFESMEEFNEWYSKVNVNDATDESEQIELPKLDLNGKNPKDFTWEEYCNLTVEEQMYFPDCFESMEEFNEWYESNKLEEQIIG